MNEIIEQEMEIIINNISTVDMQNKSLKLRSSKYLEFLKVKSSITSISNCQMLEHLPRHLLKYIESVHDKIRGYGVTNIVN